MSEQERGKTNTWSAIPDGTRVGRYTIAARIGAGGMGDVYLADDEELGRRVALKFLLPGLCHDEECRSRFEREARAIAKLDHPNIVTIYEVGEHGDQPCFAMQYVRGMSLRDLIADEPVDLNRAIELAAGICEGLSTAHKAGIIHRDIKPSNILLDSDGRPKILDFGLAITHDRDKITKSGSTIGTVGYMSPEQVHGKKVDYRSDIFSLGVVMYELFSGQAPFRGGNFAAVLNSIINDNPKPLDKVRKDLPLGLSIVVERLLQKNRDDRYQSVNEVAEDLRDIKHGIDLQLSDLTHPIMPIHRSSPKRLATGISLIFLLAILTALVMPTMRNLLSRWFVGDVALARQHLAVLPFTCFGESETSEAFCAGLTETITSKITQLQQFKGSLWVVPMCEIRDCGVVSPGEAHRVLGINLAVTGSVQKLDNQMRVTLNLIDAETQRQLQSAVIDDSAVTVASFQDSLVANLASMLGVQLLPEQHSILAAGGTTRKKVYDVFIEGRGFLQRHWEEWGIGTASIDTSIVMFQKAIDMDRGYAPAHAALGEAYWRKYEFTKDSRWADLALTSSLEAIELDDQLSSAYVSLGLVYDGRGMYERAVGEFSKALDHDPFNHNALTGLAAAYEALNESEKAESTYFKTITLRPDYWYGYIDLGFYYCYKGRKQDALQQLQTILPLEPQGAAAWSNIGALYFYLERREDAGKAWKKSIEIHPNYPAYSNLGSLYHMEGDEIAAIAMYEKALELDDHDYQVWMNLAGAYQEVPEYRSKAHDTFLRTIEMAEEQRLINPRDPLLLSDLADCYAMVGDSARAILIGERAVALAPDNNLVLARIGMMCEMVGQRERALDCIGEALSLGYPLTDIEHFSELDRLRQDERFQHMVDSVSSVGSGDPSSK